MGSNAPGYVPEGCVQGTYVGLCGLSLSSLSLGNKFLHLQRIKCHLPQCEATMQLQAAKDLGS